MAINVDHTNENQNLELCCVQPISHNFLQWKMFLYALVCPLASVAKINVTDRSLIQLRLLYYLNKCGDETFAITGPNPILFALHGFA